MRVSFSSLTAGRRLFSTGSVLRAEQATSSKSQKLVVTLCSPYKTFLKAKEVERVDIPATSGDMGILANHVPTIQQLKPGVIQVLLENNETKKVFASGGFAVMNPDNTLNINVVEGALPEEIDKNNVSKAMQEAQRSLDKAQAEDERALLQAQLEVYQAMEKVSE